MLEAVLLILGGVFGIYLLLLYNAFSWGWVLLKFWYWFLLPVFPMLPHIGISAAIGLALCLTLFKTHSSHGYQGKLGSGEKVLLKRKSEKSDWITGILAPWIVLSIAWLIKLVL